MADLKVGTVTHFFGNINVGVIEVEDTFEVGDTIKIVGRGEEFEQEVESMEVDHEQVDRAEPGSEVAIKVKEGEQVKEGDEVFKVQ